MMKTALFPTLLLAAALFAACGDDKNPGEQIGTIEVPNRQELTQTLAPGATTGGVTFTTDGAWSSSIAETRAAGWIAISPDHGDKAGTYTLEIKLTPNETDAARTATITIRCGESKIEIEVTQQPAGSEEPTPGPEISAENRVVRIDWYNNHASADETGTARLTYDTKGRLLSYEETGGYRIDNTYDDEHFTGTTRYLYPEGDSSGREYRFNSLWCATYERTVDNSYTTESVCTYDAEGRLLKEEATSSDSSSQGDAWQLHLTWADGNIVRIEEKHTPADKTDDPSYEWETSTCVLEYYDDENPFERTWVDPVLTAYLDQFGLGTRGRHCRNLLKSATTTYSDSSEETDWMSFEYTFDDKGRVIRCDYKDNYSGSEKNRYDIYTYAE